MLGGKCRQSKRYHCRARNSRPLHSQGGRPKHVGRQEGRRKEGVKSRQTQAGKSRQGLEDRQAGRLKHEAGKSQQVGRQEVREKEGGKSREGDKAKKVKERQAGKRT